MQPWSDNPISEDFTVRIFSDTNILAYLVDNTYPSLNDFYEIARLSPFCELVSSKYVMFEFVGIRKREHYLRKVASKSSKSFKGELNFSSLTNQKYINSFSAPEIDSFEDIVEEIKEDVQNEISNVIRDFNINFDYSNLHEGQLLPAFDLCLSTKISNHDSLVLISSILPTPKNSEKNVLLFTHDDGMASSFRNGLLVDSVLSKHQLQKPFTYLISNYQKVNFKTSIELADLRTHFNNGILEIIKKINKKHYLGTTFPAYSVTVPVDVVCLELVENFQLPQNVYITIISKNLDYIYTTKVKVDAFWHNGVIVTDPAILPQNQTNNVSFRISDIDENAQLVPVSNTILTSLKEKGNLVFVHPDST